MDNQNFFCLLKSVHKGDPTFPFFRKLSKEDTAARFCITKSDTKPRKQLLTIIRINYGKLISNSQVLQSSAVSTGNRNVLVIHNITYPCTQRNKQSLDIGIRIDNGGLASPDLEDPSTYGTQFSSNVDFSLPQHRSQLMYIILRENKASLAVIFSKDTLYRFELINKKSKTKKSALNKVTTKQGVESTRL